MRDLSAADLLVGWEHGLGRGADERALILLAVALPDTTAHALARLPIGQRDAALLTMRERVFGSRMVSRAACPACGESLEMNFTVDEIRAQGPGAEAGARPVEDAQASVPLHDYAATLAIAQAGYEIRFRLPNTLDVWAAARTGNLNEARSALLERCVLEASYEGSQIAAGALPEAVRTAIAGHMAESDPQGDVRLGLTCQACNHAWQAPFDIGAYFWEELHAWALRMLREVHILASAYGWREADILALSPTRRQMYMDMVQG
jgi:hypothetical protein